VLGLDAAAPAAFLGLLAPRLRGREPWLVAAVALLLRAPFLAVVAVAAGTAALIRLL